MGNVLVILGLGGNIGDRAGYLRAAVEGLARLLTELRASSLYESAPLLPEKAPAGWSMPFLNMAVCGLTDLRPEALLTELKRLETSIGRTPAGRWGPREIDIDILAYGREIIDTPEIRIPHPGLLKRDFALLPLAELCPDWKFPATAPYEGRNALQLVEAIGFSCGADLRKLP